MDHVYFPIHQLMFFHSMLLVYLSIQSHVCLKKICFTCGCPGGGQVAGMDWVFGISRCKLLYWVGQKVHLGFFVRCFGKIQTNFLANPIYRMDKQQGPTVEHRELYSISCDKPS